MLNWLIGFALRHRALVLVLALACAAGGVASLRYLDIDAFPDTTPVQVQVNTVAPALGPDDVEQQITSPIEQVISGLPRLQQVRSVSKFGLSQVVITFDDGTDIYFARQLINERLSTVELPANIERPKLGPVATGLGEVFHYIVSYKGADLAPLSEAQREEKLRYVRMIQDWVIKPKLRTVKGVAEVNSWGGYEKQYQVRIDPDRLVNYGLTFHEVVEAIEKNNANVGGGQIQQGSDMLLIHGMGRTSNAQELRQIVVRAKDGVPVHVGDVADVEVGHEIRRGAVTADGKGEVVLGLGFMLMGENSHRVTRALKTKLEEIKKNLPADIRVTPVYDRMELVDHVIETARQNLFEGGLLVIAVLFMFLGNLRAAAIVALAIPLSMLFAFSGMLRFGIAASLLSLGAIDFGMVVDSSVVMVENCIRHIALGATRECDHRTVIHDAAVEVRKPTLFGELIIMIVYLPILTLEGVEGKMFRPMALTVIFALAGSMVLSLMVMPVLASLLLPRRLEEREPLLVHLVKRLYRPVLRFALEQRFAVLGCACAVLVIAFAMIAPHLGSEFVPRLSEGAIAVSVVRLAGTDLHESTRYNTQMEKAILAAFPDEVAHVWSRSGTAEVATDPMGVELTDLFITLKPREQWRVTDESGNPVSTQAELTEQIAKTLRDLPGQHFESSQPIEMRLNEMVSGVKSAVAVKLFGDDFAVLREKAKEIERVLNSIDGHTDVTVEQITGQPVLEIKIDQRQIARYGIPAKDVLDLIQSLGSKPLGEVIEGQMRFPLVVHLPDKYRTSPKAIGAMLVTTPAGGRVPLERLATIERLQGPSTITREWGQRRIVVTCNVRGRDVGSFVDEARDRVEAEVPLPDARYHVEWGGQFENLQRARTRLLIVLPIALGLIFGLLYLTYHNAVDALRVFASVPFAWVGGVLALWLRGMPFSIPAAVGFIALSGVAVLNDMILVSYTALLREQGLCIDEAVEHAALTRLRPVLMTALVASLGFLPMAMSTGMGAEVQRPLATVVIGGVISAMLTSLIVSRVIYLLFDSGAQAVYVWLRRGLGVGTAVLQPLFGLHGARGPGDTAQADSDSTRLENDV